jgi:hypothetical protein
MTAMAIKRIDMMEGHKSGIALLLQRSFSSLSLNGHKVGGAAKDSLVSKWGGGIRRTTFDLGDALFIICFVECQLRQLHN